MADEGPPHPLVVNPANAKPGLVVAVHVDVPPAVVSDVQATVPPTVGLALPVTVGNTNTLANEAV